MKRLIISLTFFTIVFSANFLGRRLETAQFKERERGAGILMHITSLPSKYGIGTLGNEAFKFVDFLVRAKQKNWQMLPLGPTSYGDSPYQSTSSYAGNPYMIDLELLIDDGLLKEKDLEGIEFSTEPQFVDFGKLWENRFVVLKKAFENFNSENPKFKAFCSSSKHWLDDYALFMALKEYFNYKSWIEWPKEYKLRNQEALNKIRPQLEDTINFHKFLQFKFDEQFQALRKYCKSKKIKIIGDVPIYVPLDSSDVWSAPEIFQLDKDANPLRVAGVPPDAFTADGQLWGNPLYDWEKMAKNDYEWFINRLRATGEKFDVIRIDHFRGLESYWSVPAKDKTAKNGKWVKGPDMGLIRAIHTKLPNIEFIAEDLGYLTPEVLALREGSGFPGMKVLEFAFDPREKSDYLPHTYTRNSVCYAGTHDNQVLQQWQKEIPAEDRQYAEEYLGQPISADLRMPILRAGMSSVSYLFVAQLQDYLNLGGSSRMNRPGITDGKNWRWRVTSDELTNDLAETIAKLTTLYSRD